MTQFLHINLNLPEFIKLDQRHNTRPTCSQNVCISCRKEDLAFILLSTCKHASLFDLFDKYKVDYQNVVICLQCHHFLKKVELFKLQVEESLAILNKQTQTFKPSKRLFQDLQCTKTEVFVHNSQQNKHNTYKDEIVKDEFSETNSTQDHYNKNTTEIKVEHESYSDFDNDVQLSQSVFVHNSQQNEQNTCKDEIVIDESSETNSTQDQYNKITTEIKVEHVSYSDLDNDVPLAQIKKVIKSKKKKVKSTKEVSIKSQKKTSLDQKYEGKIAVIYLSRQEMWLERDRDAAKASYLKLLYKCDSCITGFDQELTLQDHMQKKHGLNKKGHTCDICKSVLSTQNSYKLHIREHTRRYECQACGKRNKNIHSVVKHYNEEHGTISTQYKCRDCDFTADSHRSFRYHREKHKQKQQCSLCDSTFVNNAGLRVHMFTVHKQSSRVYSCEECNKEYNARSSLAYHIASTHGNCLVYCAPCRKHFRTKKNLAQHLNTHSAHVSENDKSTVHKQSSRVYSCEECNKVYNAKSSLVYHIASAHGDCLAYCAPCRKHFRSKKNLAQHLKTHSAHISDNDKRFICDECGMKFLTKAALQEHIVFVHLKSSKHECKKCQKSYRLRPASTLGVVSTPSVLTSLCIPNALQVFKNGSALRMHDNFVHKKIRPPSKSRANARAK